MKGLISLALLLASTTAFAGTIQVTGNPTDIEITNRLFFKIDGTASQNPANCPSDFRYEVVLEDGTSSTENKKFVLSLLLAAKALKQPLVFSIHDSNCSSGNYPAAIGVRYP